jgi:hypothetical protein
MVLGFKMFIQTLGLASKFLAFGIWESFPDYKKAAKNNHFVYLHNCYLQIGIGVAFIIFAILDHRYFIFHPLELGIVIDLQEKRNQD